MANNNPDIQFYTKSELARMANVSYSTFYRYMLAHRKELSKMGISIYAKKLPPDAIRFICNDYCVDR